MLSKYTAMSKNSVVHNNTRSSLKLQSLLFW